MQVHVQWEGATQDLRGILISVYSPSRVGFLYAIVPPLWLNLLGAYSYSDTVDLSVYVCVGGVACSRRRFEGAVGGSVTG